jgi:DMSO/TMAO reductase YedYZ molybdopterin-dependent catalytic subunit
MVLTMRPLPRPVSRRRFLQRTALAGTAGLLGLRALADETVTLPFANGQRPLVRYPGKRAMILQTSRPPQLETPFSVFNEGVITPNDAFFVRYHLANIPLSIDPEAFRVAVKGHVNTPLSLSVADLRKFETVEVVAVNQCSGNSRGFFQPRVGGGQLGNGAMGNAKWRGVRLKDVLEKAGLQAGAKQVVFNGLDTPVVEKTPDFIKALEMEHALDGEVMLAFEMNGEALPMLNGFPLRLVVPGCYGTYWVKHLHEITVIPDTLENFWMATAYRIPCTPNAAIPPGSAPAKTEPIQRFNVRSFITNLADGDKVTAGQPTMLNGIAFDGGAGIREVLVSADGGNAWQTATLGNDLGRYSFRLWKLPVTIADRGRVALKCRAISRTGESQPLEPLWNPSGYMRNVVETVTVQAS